MPSLAPRVSPIARSNAALARPPRLSNSRRVSRRAHSSGGPAFSPPRRRTKVALDAMPPGSSSSSAASSFARADTSLADANGVPALAVFDLDACFWDQEMFQLRELVDASAAQVLGELVPGDPASVGVVGARSGDAVIRIHAGALRAMQAFHAGEYPGMRVAAASSADTPLAVKIGRSALATLEIQPGVTAMDVFATGFDAGFEGNLQIGRTPPLSSNKAATHFPFLRQNTGVPFDRMLFFDDCNWGDHCGAVERGCREKESGRGPVTVRTPRGLQPADWENGMRAYAARNAEARGE